MRTLVEKFLNSQDAGVYEMALKEIQNGRKQSHWMWYIFPQMSGLGWSWMAQKYEFQTFDEVEEFLSNDTLKERIIEISKAVYNLENVNISYVFTYPDDLKFKSCMTLFSLMMPEYDIFKKNLEKYFDGEVCEHTKNRYNTEKLGITT